MNKRLKDTQMKYKIKIEVIQKHLKDNDLHSNIPYLICLEISHEDKKIMTSFPYNQKGKNELIKTIKEECSLSNE